MDGVDKECRQSGRQGTYITYINTQNCTQKCIHNCPRKANLIFRRMIILKTSLQNTYINTTLILAAIIARANISQ